MNNGQINELIATIQRLQISLTQTQVELNRVRRQVRNNEEAEEGADRRDRQEATEEREGFRIGDQVRILNGVRLSGNIRNSRNVEGVIIRFTSTYVIVRITPPVGRYQDVRQAFHNVQSL